MALPMTAPPTALAPQIIIDIDTGRLMTFLAPLSRMKLKLCVVAVFDWRHFGAFWSVGVVHSRSWQNSSASTAPQQSDSLDEYSNRQEDGEAPNGQDNAALPAQHRHAQQGKQPGADQAGDERGDEPTCNDRAHARKEGELGDSTVPDNGGGPPWQQRGREGPGWERLACVCTTGGSGRCAAVLQASLALVFQPWSI